MRTSGLWALVAALFAAGPGCVPSEGERLSPDLVVRGGRLFDGTGSPPIDDAVVVIRDGQILAAGRPGAVPLPGGARLLDARGKTILPGLFDAHVHLNSALRDNESAARDWLLAGVTTVVDMGTTLGPQGLRQRLRELPDATPRALVAGPILTAPGGYPFVGPNSSAVGLASPEQVTRVVAPLLAEGGSDHLKVAVERGFLADRGDDGWPVPTARVLRAIADSAHRAGRRVSVHVTQSGELEAALEAGMDNAAHTPVDVIPEELLRRAAVQNFVLVSTLGLWRDTPDLLANAQLNVRRYVELGGRVALGTDAPAFQKPGVPHGEMELLRAAGLSPTQVLLAATRDAAFAFGRVDTLGTIEPGKVADAIVVDGDPLQDLQDVRNVAWVIHEGTIIEASPR